MALARCLVMEPSLVLLDEPLANLDVHLRAAMEEEFVDFHGKTGATMLYITHDQAEAMALADRVAVMDDGRLVQVADPHTLYEEPATTMVADFIGQGVVVPGLVTRTDGHGSCEVEFCGERLELRCARQQPPGPAGLSLRPEFLDLAPSRRHRGHSGPESCLPGQRRPCGASSTAAVSMTSRFTCPALRDTHWC